MTPLVEQRPSVSKWHAELQPQGHTGDVVTTTLCRPVGQPKLDLMAASKWRRFPPRLDWRPIFYPVLNEAYATRIARKWNTRDAANGNVGYVLSFDVDTDFPTEFEVRQVGDDTCLEYWIPSESLDAFNDHLDGEIHLLSEWRTRSVTGRHASFEIACSNLGLKRRTHQSTKRTPERCIDFNKCKLCSYEDHATD